MHGLTVTRLKDGKRVTVEATHVKMLLDHLEASAGRNGFEVFWHEPGVFGNLKKDGVTVAIWEVN